MTKEAIIFIPGFHAKGKDYYLNNLLLVGLAGRLEKMDVSIDPDPVKIEGQSGRRVIVQNRAGDSKTIDVYEAYWSDLVDRLSDKNAKERVVRGLFLFVYWLFSSMWKMARKSRMMFVQFVLMLLLMILWYYSNVVMALVAIGENPSAFGVQLPPDWAQWAIDVGRSLGSWRVWAGVSLLISILPVPLTALVDVVDFTTRYAQDEAEAGVGGLRDRLRARVRDALEDVLAAGDYDRVTVLGHSFGVIVGIDLLADYRSPNDRPVRFVSMGGIIEFLSYKSHWVMHEMVRCLENPCVETWADYHSEQDWLCTRTPISDPELIAKFDSHRLQWALPLEKRLSGEVHNAYFFDRMILEDLAGMEATFPSEFPSDS